MEVERATEEGRERTYLAWKRRRRDEKTRITVSHSAQMYQIYVKVKADLVNLSREKRKSSFKFAVILCRIVAMKANLTSCQGPMEDS